MSKIDYQALREAAVKAGKDKWQAKKINGDFFVIRHGSYTRQHGYTSYQPIAEIGCKPVRDFVARANPATVLALLDERERNQQYIKRRDQENEDIALTVGKLRVELEGKDSKIANLTAERDALREGEMGDARYSNTRAAADIYFQLVEECEIPAGGSLVEYVDDMREKLEAAEKRIAELEAREVVLPRAHDVHPLGPQSAKIFCEFHRSIVNRCADEIRKVGVKVSIKGN
ncbi:ead/Ea22-like family protein [Escherichia coli]|nr:ead/Ea22-like family protein [Escherichia coli]EKD7797217.1 ead/Ea22-like family protein [Escherichia coli]